MKNLEPVPLIEQNTVLPNRIICNPRLSLKARGLYALLTAHAPAMLSLEELELSPIDESNVKSALQELKVAGLVRWAEE